MGGGGSKKKIKGQGSDNLEVERQQDNNEQQQQQQHQENQMVMNSQRNNEQTNQESSQMQNQLEQQLQQQEQNRQKYGQQDDEDEINEQVNNMSNLLQDIEFQMSDEMQPFNAKQIQKRQPDFGEDISAIYSDDDVIETSTQEAQRIFERLEKVQAMKDESSGKERISEEKSKLNLKTLYWPPTGECKVMSVVFKVVYSHKDLDLKLLRSYDHTTTSSLSWNKHPQLQAYEFKIQDNSIFDETNCKTIKLQNNSLSFIVTPTGKFVCIKDEGEYVKKARKNATLIKTRDEKKDLEKELSIKQAFKSQQAKSKLQREQQRDRILVTAENNLKEMWTKQMGRFLERPKKTKKKPVNEGGAEVQDNNDTPQHEGLDSDKDKDTARKLQGDNEEINPEGSNLPKNSPQQQNQEISTAGAAAGPYKTTEELEPYPQPKTQQQNQEQLTKTESTSTAIQYNGFACTKLEKYEEHSREKMEKFLRDKLQSDQQYFKKCFENNKKTVKDKLKVWDIIDETDEQKELIPNKFRFPVLRRHEKTIGIMEDKGKFTRPQCIMTDSCKVVVIDHKRDLCVDVQQELRLLVFLYPQNTDQQNEIHFYQELAQFKDICDDALKTVALDLFRVRALPLTYKPKLKKKYFELY